MITSILNWLLGFLLAPINIAISEYAPDLTDMILAVQDFFDGVNNVICFVISYTGLSVTFIHGIAYVLQFCLYLTLAIYPLKLFINWLKSFLR